MAGEERHAHTNTNEAIIVGQHFVIKITLETHFKSNCCYG